MSHTILTTSRLTTLKRRHLLSASLSLLTGSAFAVTPPDAGQSLQQLQQLPPPSVQSTPAPTLSNDTHSNLSPANTEDTTRVPVTRLRFSGNTRFDSATLSRVAGKLGQETSLGDLRAAAERVSHFYRARGYILARAYLPPQDISNGVVTIAILEGRLDHINVNNQSKVSTREIQTLLDAQQPSNQPVRSDYANRALLLLQAVPGVGAIQGSLRPSSVVGSTELNVDVAAAPLIAGYVGLDNSGNRFTGAARVNAGVNVNNLTGIGDQLSLQGVLTNQDQMDYGRVAWDTPVGSQGLRLGAAFSNLRYTLGENFASLEAHGVARTAAVYGSLPLLVTPESHINTSLSIENRDLTDVTGAVDLDNKRGISATVFTVSGDFRDSALYTPAVSAWRVVNTAGRVDLRTPSVFDIDDATARTAGLYDKIVLSATREQLLPANFSLYLSATAQRSDKNLDSSEQLTLGGPNGIRAYPEGEATGDQGWIGTLELRYHVTPKVQVFGFYDAGGIEANRYPYIEQQNGRHLSGSGIGASSSWGPFSLKTSLAWRAGSAPPTSDTDRRPRIWAQGSYAF